MFTGIVTHMGRVRSRTGGASGGGEGSGEDGEGGDARFVIEAPFAAAPAAGASVCCSGVCLTVVEAKDGAFAADVSAETLSRTTLGAWRAGTPVNLERALRAGDELGGHIVSGHVDGAGRIADLKKDGASWRLEIEAPAALAPFIAEKGSITVDGVSLTVNAVQGAVFGVNIIPHTMAETTLGRAGQGAPVNLEIDMLARYVARLLDAGPGKG